MIEQRMISISAGISLEKFKKLKPGDQRLYLKKYPHSRYWAFHRRPTKPVKPHKKVVPNTHVVDGTFDRKQIEKAAADLAENNPALEKQVDDMLSAKNSMENEGGRVVDDDPDTRLNEDEAQKPSGPEDAVDVDEIDNKRLAVNRHLDKKASTASTIMWALLAAGALVAAPMLLPFADMASKEFGDSIRAHDEKEVDKELTYEEFKKDRNKTGRTLTRDEDKSMRKHYDLWLESDEDDNFTITGEKPLSKIGKPDEEPKKESTKDYIRDTAAKAMVWLADKGMEKLEARYANMKRLQALNEPEKRKPRA